MPNTSGNAYGLTTLCPLLSAEDCVRMHPRQGLHDSPATLVKDFLNDLPTDEDSPMARVPNTYLCRFFVLDDVVYEGDPAVNEHLKSKYLVFTSNFHGTLEPYLAGMWEHAEAFVRKVFRYCVAFDGVQDVQSFTSWLKRCQVKTTFYFNGSTDVPLAEQLKALYLKQEFAKFAAAHQLKPKADPQAVAELQKAFGAFVERVRPRDLTGPSWRPGASSLETAVTGEG
jgi:hypothetical protein